MSLRAGLWLRIAAGTSVSIVLLLALAPVQPEQRLACNARLPDREFGTTDEHGRRSEKRTDASCVERFDAYHLEFSG